MTEDQKAVPLGFARLSAIQALPESLRKFGIDPHQFMQPWGVDSAVFRNPDHLFDYSVACEILAAAARQTDCEHFGLLVASSANLPVLGPLAAAMGTKPTVRSALRTAAALFHTQDRGAYLTLARQGSSASLTYTIFDPRVRSGGQVSLVSITTAYNVLAALCGKDWQALEVRLPQRKPRSDTPFTHFFKCPTLFNEPSASISFAAEMLDRPVLLGAVDETDDEPATELQKLDASKILVMLTDRLLSGRSIAVDAVSEVLAVNRKTIYRHLLRQGVNYNILKEQARLGAAKRLLLDTNLSMIEIALLIGYTEASSFTRAFRQSEGMTPSSFRDQTVEVRRTTPANGGVAAG